MAASSSSSLPSPSPSPSPARSSTRLTNLDEDSLAHCAAYLDLPDVCNMAMSCSYLKRVAYSDPVWERLFRDKWNLDLPSNSSPSVGARDMYLARHTAVQQFNFSDPFGVNMYLNPTPFSQLILDTNRIFYSQGSLVEVMNVVRNEKGTNFFNLYSLRDHKARITCMRLFSLDEITLYRGEAQREQNVLVTSSCDHSIRLWLKGSCVRCLRGHNGPVLSLSNKLLGDDSSKVLASGGEDCTVRLWSLSSSGKRGQHALKATLYGHEKPVNLISVAGHKTSLLVSISRDSKVRVWDTATSSAVRSSCCVGMTSVPGAPVNMKCHESLLYVAAGSSVTAVDLRTMQKVITAAVHQPKLYSFDIVPSKSLICTGGYGRAMLWDIRRNQEPLNPEPIAELDGHNGSVTLLHMDAYKIVTGGPDDVYVNVWEAGTGAHTNSLLSCNEDYANSFRGEAMAVNGCRIITAGCVQNWGVMCYRDFNNATCPVTKVAKEPSSKFWDSVSDGNSDGG